MSHISRHSQIAADLRPYFFFNGRGPITNRAHSRPPFIAPCAVNRAVCKQHTAAPKTALDLTRSQQLELIRWTLREGRHELPRRSVLVQDR
jgi:hypothetical protein